MSRRLPPSQRRDKNQLLRLIDFERLLLIGTLLPVAWLAPEGWWRPVCRF